MKLRALLILFLIASSNCGLADAIIRTFCRVSLLLGSFTVMINEATAGKGLDLDTLKKALNDPKCGGNIALSQIPPDLQGLYHLTNQAGDLLGKLFNLELHLQKTYLDKKMQVGSDSQFDYFTKLNLNTDTTIKPSDDSVVYNIKGNVVMKEGSFKPDINVNNLAVDKIKKLTGIDVTKMEASLEQKLALLPDGKFTVKANGDQLELSYSSTAKLGNTNLNGSVGFIIEPNPKPNQPSTVSESFATAKEYAKQLSSNMQTAQLAVLAGAATMLGMSMESRSPAVGTAVVTTPLMFLFGH